MSLFLLLNPKFFDPGGVVAQVLDADPIKKKKEKEIEIIEEIKEEIIQEIVESKTELQNNYSDELRVKINEVENLTNRLDLIKKAINSYEIEQNILKLIKIQEENIINRQKIIQKIIDNMKEEEEFLLLMLLN